MASSIFLPDLLWEPMIRQALMEDLGTGGDLTTQLLVSSNRQVEATFRTRSEGIVAGLAGARLAFSLLDPSVRFDPSRQDGDRVEAGETLAVVRGSAAAVLAGERTALNILSHFSGIATETSKLVARVAGTKAAVCCTRKTLPGLRIFQKYAVVQGGGASIVTDSMTLFSLKTIISLYAEA